MSHCLNDVLAGGHLFILDDANGAGVKSETQEDEDHCKLNGASFVIRYHVLLMGLKLMLLVSDTPQETRRSHEYMARIVSQSPNFKRWICGQSHRRRAHEQHRSRCISRGRPAAYS